MLRESVIQKIHQIQNWMNLKVIKEEILENVEIKQRNVEIKQENVEIKQENVEIKQRNVKQEKM